MLHRAWLASGDTPAARANALAFAASLAASDGPVIWLVLNGTVLMQSVSQPLRAEEIEARLRPKYSFIRPPSFSFERHCAGTICVAAAARRRDRGAFATKIPHYSPALLLF